MSLDQQGHLIDAIIFKQDAYFIYYKWVSHIKTID